MTVARRKQVKANGLIIISPKEFENEVHEKSIVFALVANEIVGDSLDEKPKKVMQCCKSFRISFHLNSLMSYLLYMTFNTS
jgi:hypothetical protein